MNLQQALNKATQQLEKQKEPRLDAEVLLAFVLEKDKAYLYAHPEQELLDMQESYYFDLITRRENSEPIAYLTGSQDFYGYSFHVTEDTLIPRPETETLVEALISVGKQLDSPKILDVGTGSGCIAISLAKSLEQEVDACDISEAALEVASHNAEKLKAAVSFVQSDLLDNISNSYDIIVANLPYLAPEDIETSPTEKDLRFEPQLALLADDDGLELIKTLIKQSETKLNPSGYLFLELLPRQIDAVRNFVHEKTAFSFSTIKDLSNQDRFIRLQRNDIMEA